jgi:uncharacterized protein (DUF362 family)
MVMKLKTQFYKTLYTYLQKFNSNFWPKLVLFFTGLGATVWFLIRVIPKPSRASYPCQRAAFPIASGFVLWLIGLFTIKPAISKIRKAFPRHLWLSSALVILLVGGYFTWTLTYFSSDGFAQSKSQIATSYDFIPAKSNDPKGNAKGIFPGRVVWARDPKATLWKGNWKAKTDQYWTDENTDQKRVDAMFVTTLTKLTGKNTEEKAWDAIFNYHNTHVRGLNQGYKTGEVVAIKINLNNSEGANKPDNYTDATPQMVLAVVKQLVQKAHVAPQDIIIYDVRRIMPQYLLLKVWNEFKDVRFVQGQTPQTMNVKKPNEIQPVNPGYGDYHGLEVANWVKGIEYSNGKYDKARLMAKQVLDATYIINLALLKAHSYPYNDMENGDEGQTGVSMCGKNHFGSIMGTSELHGEINTNQNGKDNSYSPMVDLAASPNLGAKTILYVLDALYSGRKWRTYPVHFPNPPFNNQVEPYENSEWPASVLASLDGVALDCVGLDIYNSQTKNNINKDGHSRLMLRVNADNYLKEMAMADNPPSGTKYIQGGKPVQSLGVFEHWDNDLSRKYSRNLNPKKGKGIELIYLPLNK